MSDDLLARIVGKSPRHLLEELGHHARTLAKHALPRPEVELHLTSGASLRGRVVGVAEDRNGSIVTLQVGWHASAPAVSFVRIDQIIAVTVADATLLVDGPMPVAAAPGRLELARQVAVHGELISAAVGHPVTVELAGDLDDAGRRAISLLLPVLSEVIAAVARDDMGKVALVPVVQLQLSAGASSEVTRPAPTTLAICASIRLADRPAAALRTALEAVL